MSRKCYAAALGGCSAGLTREHYISEGVLLEMEKLGPVKVSGVPWTAQSKAIGPSALTARILCSNHNSRLSGLDSEALKLFTWLSTVSLQGIPMSERVDLDGYLFERWLLKVICGLLASGNLTLSDTRLIGTPHHDWLEILFGLAPMPRRYGIYQWSGTEENEYQPGISVRCVYNVAPERVTLKGAVFTVHGIRWLLAMDDPSLWGEPSAGWRAYRMDGLRVHGSDRVVCRLHMKW